MIQHSLASASRGVVWCLISETGADADCVSSKWNCPVCPLDPNTAFPLPLYTLADMPLILSAASIKMACEREGHYRRDECLWRS